ncbi:sigma-70 family RNA polymerase sigma factor [bacterium]|nr:sigma-70 family RNA polymerase sigma factor [bacterium]MBQ9246918.1 sigma-70 family RNA polymerase sigma factor [bacterium]
MDFNKVIESNKQNIKNIIRLITKEDNEDLEQEVYLKIWKNSDKYKEKGSIKSWISTITRNTSLDYLKSSYQKVFRTSTSEDNVISSIKDKKISPEEKIVNLERQKKIIDAINSLKPKFKEVIMICEINGYTYEDCAKKLNCPIGTVKSRIYNAKKELAEKLQDLL